MVNNCKGPDMKGMLGARHRAVRCGWNMKWESTQFVCGERIDLESEQLLKNCNLELKIIPCTVLPLHHHLPLWFHLLHGVIYTVVSGGHTALLTTWGLGYGGFKMLASAHVLPLHTNKIWVFHAGLRIKIWGPVRFVVCQSSVFRVKSKVQRAW